MNGNYMSEAPPSLTGLKEMSDWFNCGTQGLWEQWWMNCHVTYCLGHNESENDGWMRNKSGTVLEGVWEASSKCMSETKCKVTTKMNIVKTKTYEKDEYQTFCVAKE